MNRLLHFLIFIAGLAAVFWIGTHYVASNPLALAVTALIGVVYLVGAFELYRYRQASDALTAALEGLTESVSALDDWVVRLPSSLRNAVRLRVEGERVGLPGPALTPYLVGLLVLLGMLGTFLGMVATLRGTGLALESATDLQAIRASLSAPVKGLGFAFGTSVAGVATSAMLGLLSALSRRDRVKAAQLLDTNIATTLRPYSLAHQREERLRLLQRQADTLPAVVDQMQAMMVALAQHSKTLAEQLSASQEAFHSKAEATYTRLATSVEQSLRDGIAEGARAAGSAIQPVAESTMSLLVRENAALHESVRQAVQQQLDGMAVQAEGTASKVAGIWATSLQAHQQTNASLASELRGSFETAAGAFGQRSDHLFESISERLAGVAETLSQAWQQGLLHHERSSEKLASDNQQALASATDALRQHAESLALAMTQSHGDLKAQLASQDAQRLAAWVDTLSEMTSALRGEWEQATSYTESRQQQICDALAQTASQISTETKSNATATMAEISRLVEAAAEAPKAAAALQETLVAQDQQRLQAWTDSLASTAATLREQWEQAGTHTAAHQQQICETLIQTASEISAQTKSNATATMAEINRLVEAAAEAPKAAAALQETLVAQDQQRLQAWTDSLASTAATLREQWEQAGTHTAAHQQQICETLIQTASEISAQTKSNATATMAEISRLVEAAAEAPKAAAALQETLAEQDQQRLQAWTESLASTAATLREQWEQAGTHTAAHQQQICDALAQTALDISRETKANADATIAEISKLLQAASEAPQAAADVVTEVRQKLSDSLARDTAMLEERGRLLETVGTLLDAVNHAASEQRSAVDALVTTSADMLDRASAQFTDHVQTESGKLTGVAAQVSGSAADVAMMAETFSAAVQKFGESNVSLQAHLERIEAALEKSTTRSDEQLAYYVAQAREVIDLSMLSQKQIIEELQQLAGGRVPASADAT
ncbi:DUF802 domain-containing protein [Alcaligenaceae bacterium]|nr:DUF802 domain-containing protein [Alcaligenaceae bacterium]